MDEAVCNCIHSQPESFLIIFSPATTAQNFFRPIFQFVTPQLIPGNWPARQKFHLFTFCLSAFRVKEGHGVPDPAASLCRAAGFVENMSILSSLLSLQPAMCVCICAQACGPYIGVGFLLAGEIFEQKRPAKRGVGGTKRGPNWETSHRRETFPKDFQELWSGSCGWLHFRGRNI